MTAPLKTLESPEPLAGQSLGEATGSVISCNNCKHWERAKPYGWGLCKYETPWWSCQSSPVIHPTENNAKDCDCYSPNRQIKKGKCIRIPKKNDDSFELVIPDCVIKQIKDITKKKT